MARPSHQSIPEVNNRLLSRGFRATKTQIQIKLSDQNIQHMKPTSDRVVIKSAPAEEKTSGGIIIPDTAKEKPQRGEVIAVGPGKKDNPMTVSVGDTVLYGKYAGQEVTIDGNDYLIMREDDILVVI